MPQQVCNCTADTDCAPFEDGNPCNGTMKCSAGACVLDAASVVVCDAGNDSQCRKNQCNPSTGVCEQQFMNVGVGCSDGNACTSLDVCDGTGVCVGSAAACNDGKFCNGTETYDVLLAV